ncbi:MAG: formylglycine-generating enzyme family protein [Nitrospiraceae bacterium]
MSMSVGVPRSFAMLHAALMGMMVVGVVVAPSWSATVLDPVRMIDIPAGPFLMGTDQDNGRDDERPRRSVYVDQFAIDEVEVTNARYLGFVQATGHRLPPSPYGDGPLSLSPDIAALPVVQVTWYDAKAYCAWTKKRLPTEAEWEKAARGTDGRRFPWGNEPADATRARYDVEWDGTATMRPVGTLPHGDSPYGVKDMAGNAREWVEDWYDAQYYAASPDRNPVGPSKGIVRVIRGGSWHSPVADIASTSRGRGGFALQTHGTGFRCAR